MNLIDISSWQKGIDLSILFAENPLDGVIVKVTEGRQYVNPEFVGWAEWLKANNKPFGLYHFCDGLDPKEEARHFFDNAKPYIGQAVLCADYESPATSKGTAWLKAFLDAFYALSGVRCMIYCSLSVIRVQDFTGLTEHPLWIAQYADNNLVKGFVETPWQSGSVSPFPRYAMHQYTSTGWLSGWNGYLDFDKFYGSAEDWKALCGGSPVALKDADPAVVAAVLNGEYGVQADRTTRLTAAGYDPKSVQEKINELYGIALSCRKKCEGNMEYLPSIVNIMQNL